MVKLTKNGWYRQFVFNNRFIHNIIFYDDNGEIIDTSCGWFQKSNNSEILEIEVGDIKVRNKIAFNKQENFVNSFKDFHNKLNYNLYLYVDEKNIKILSKITKKEYMTDTEIHIYDVFQIAIFDEIIEIKKFIKIEPTEFGKAVKTKHEEMKILDININEYTLTELMRYFDLVKK